jgi:hypothetical protein
LLRVGVVEASVVARRTVHSLDYAQLGVALFLAFQNGRIDDKRVREENIILTIQVFGVLYAILI